MRAWSRCAVTASAAALALAGCDDPNRPLAPTAPRASLSAGAGGGSTIAYMALEPRCGIGMSTGCSDDGWWGWSTWTYVATIGVEGTNPLQVTEPFENNGADPMDPAWSPDGMKIAFQRAGEVYVVAGGGGTPRNLTAHAANDRQPAWSVNGSRIAFSSDRAGAPELYVMNASDGSGVVRLTSGVGFAGRPAWSPDGTRIAFDCVVEPGNADVCAVNADGGGFVRLTSAPGFDGDADWSPAGTIAFATDRYGAGVELATMSATGSGVQRVAPGVAGRQPDWSPDGTRLAFTSGPDVWLVGADGANAALLVPMAESPAWRPTDAPFSAIPPPVAQLGSPTCLELTCTFDGTGSTDDVGTRSLYYRWSYGDGGGDYTNTATPKHVFAKTGTYTVTLTVTAAATGLTSTATQSVTVTGLPVGAPPVASFTYSCAGLTCTLDGRGSTDDANVLAYSWNLGKETGETASGAVVTTTYASAGTRTVVLTVTDGAGQTNSTSRTFDAQPIAGDAPPVARLSVSCVELLCSYDGYASTDDNLIITHYIDPGFPSGPTLIRSGSGTIAYGTAGTYTITLTVEDGVGQRSSTSKTVTVSPAPPPDLPPTASFTWSCVRTACTFDGRASTDDQGIASYTWKLGGTSNATATGAVVTHDYRRSGTYTVTLTVRDAGGQSNSVTRSVTVVK